MPKKTSKKKYKAREAYSDAEIILGSMIETMFEDTKEIKGISPEFKWGESYQMIWYQDIPDVGLE